LLDFRGEGAKSKLGEPSDPQARDYTFLNKTLENSAANTSKYRANYQQIGTVAQGARTGLYG